MAEKRYYWLKLHDDFFSSLRIKKLRRIAGGDTYTIIYLKLQLKAMKTNGILKYSGLEEDFSSEIALDIDEEIENVKVALNYLISCGLCEVSENNTEFYFPYAVSNTGSETASTQRSRECRERQKALSDKKNFELSEKPLHCNNLQQFCNVEKDIEIDIDKDIDRDKDTDNYVNNYNYLTNNHNEISNSSNTTSNQNKEKNNSDDAPGAEAEEAVPDFDDDISDGITVHPFPLISMTAGQYKDLQKEYGNEILRDRMYHMYKYMRANGKNYENHYKVLRHSCDEERRRRRYAGVAGG